MNCIAGPVAMNNGPNLSLLPKPATRRMRSLPEEKDCQQVKCNLVYVGPNPVIKKTTKMLRKKRQEKSLQTKKKKKKSLPKSASKNQLKRRPSPTRAANESPRFPNRKASIECNMSGGAMRMARNRSRQAVNSCVTPRAPSRKASIPEMMSTASIAPCMPHRKASNPFLKGFDLQTHVLMMNDGPVMTRSQSKKLLQDTPMLDLATLRRPSRQASEPDRHHLPHPQWSQPPTHKPLTPFLNDFLNNNATVSPNQLLREPVMTRSRSKQ